MNRLFKSLPAILSAMIFAIASSAQVTTASLAGPVMDAEGSALPGAQTDISQAQISSLPAISRNIAEIARLSPFGAGGLSAAFAVNGACLNYPGLPAGLLLGVNPISLDAIDEIQVVASSYDVRQTFLTGGGINAITKSGSNILKGTAYMFYRNRNMMGDMVDSRLVAGGRDFDGTTTYGASVGGPVLRDRLFCFANFEYSQAPVAANRWLARLDWNITDSHRLAFSSSRAVNGNGTAESFSLDINSHLGANLRNRFLATFSECALLLRNRDLSDRMATIRDDVTYSTGRHKLLFGVSYENQRDFCSRFVLYAQDEWNLTRQFTLTAGVRAWKPVFDKAELVPASALCFSPLAGFVYDIPGDRGLKLRGGTGIFSGSVLPTKVPVDPEFRMPRVWKTSLALDYALEVSFPLSLSAECIFDKTLNAAALRNINIRNAEGFPRLCGADTRHIFPSECQYTGTPEYVLTNTSMGYGSTAALTISAEPLENLSIVAGYTHTTLREPTSIHRPCAVSTLMCIPSIEGPNNTGLHSGRSVVPDRLFASVIFNDASNNHYSIFYEGWHGGDTFNYSYMYTNDLNGDNCNCDLIYVPTDSEMYDENMIRFVSVEDRDNFRAFVNNDRYLTSRKGKYAEAYAVHNPWTHRVDFRFSHDFTLKCGGALNTLQLSVDVKNALNFFNSSWGVVKHMNPELKQGRILTLERIDADGVPVFSTPKAVNASTQLWRSGYSALQCWCAQIGIRYIFNQSR